MFFTKEEDELCRDFLENGYVIRPLQNKESLAQIRSNIFSIAKEYLSSKDIGDEATFFDTVHKHVSLEELNDFRVHIIRTMNADPSLRGQLYAAAKNYIDSIVGNELAMQRAVNLSIQMPNDASSLLPLHSDVWAGNSPYEIVMWTPLVDVYNTKSMFVLPRRKSEAIYSDFEGYSKMSSEEFFLAIKDDLIWLDVPFGNTVIFSHSILHGNRINEEETTRWSFNVRFKSVLSPYGTKEMGESFLPVTIRPVTRIGYEYIKPECAE